MIKSHVVVFFYLCYTRSADKVKAFFWENRPRRGPTRGKSLWVKQLRLETFFLGVK